MRDEETGLLGATDPRAGRAGGGRCIHISCACLPVCAAIGLSVWMGTVLANVFSDTSTMRGVADYPAAMCTVVQGAKLTKVEVDDWSIPDTDPSTNIVISSRSCGQRCVNYQVTAPVFVHAAGLYESGVPAVAFRDAMGVVGVGIDEDEAIVFGNTLVAAAMAWTPLPCWYDGSHTSWRAVLSQEPPPFLASRYGEINTWSIVILSFFMFIGSASLITAFLGVLMREVCGKREEDESEDE